MKKFYMVYVLGASAPTHRHDTREDAEQEAKRLANKTSGKAFVLEAVAGYEPIANVQEIALEA